MKLANWKKPTNLYGLQTGDPTQLTRNSANGPMESCGRSFSQCGPLEPTGRLGFKSASPVKA